MLPAKFLAFLILIITYNQFAIVNSVRFDIWGDLTSPNILGSDQNRWGIPFMKRTVTAVFPDDFEGKVKGIDGTIVRGIKHTNRLDETDECVPEVFVVDGGIDEERATVKIISPRGCGLDSLVEFFVEQ